MKKILQIIESIKEEFPKRTTIPLHEASFGGNERQYILDVIDSKNVSSTGKYIEKFESLISSVSSTKKAVVVINGTSGLAIALKIAGVNQGDEVITQALTFVATANAISYNGAAPVFLDVDYDTMGISPNAIKHFLESYGEKRNDGTYNKETNKKISACVPMHTFGFMCRMNEINSICNEWGIPVVEDAAQALGSSYLGKPAGSYGVLGVFSFNGNKIIISGGGGAIVTDNVGLATRARHLISTSKVHHSWNYYHDEIGFNYRLPNINAALGYAQIEQLKTFISLKKDLHNRYKAKFEKLDVKLKSIPLGTTWNYWLNSLEFDNQQERDEFLKETNNRNIETKPIWKLMFKLPMYKDCLRFDQTNAELLESRIVNIPSSIM